MQSSNNTLDIPPPVNKRYRLSRLKIFSVSKENVLSLASVLSTEWSSVWLKDIKELLPHSTTFKQYNVARMASKYGSLIRSIFVNII